MEKLTIQKLLDNLIEKFKVQYPVSRVLFSGENTADILKKLESEEKLTVESAEQILGNTSWTTLKCYECKQNVYEVIIFDGYEEIIYICKSCLKKGFEL